MHLKIFLLKRLFCMLKEPIPLGVSSHHVPVTFRAARVSWSPESQLYSPVSSNLRLCIKSSTRHPLCLISYFWLGCSPTPPFLHSTAALGFDSSQQNVAVLPSSDSWFCRGCLNVTGSAVKFERKTFQGCFSPRRIQSYHHPSDMAYPNDSIILEMQLSVLAESFLNR